MLGKLMYYDGKRQIKILGGISLIGVVITLITGLVRMLSEAYPDVVIFRMISYMTFAFSIIAIVFMVGGTMVYSMLFFRKNLFRDEGYLMHTLPVRESELFFSKLLTGTLCVYLSAIAAYICFCLATMRWNHLALLRDILVEGGISDAWIFWMALLTLLLTVPLMLCQVYASLTIGYTWRLKSGNHVSRDLLSVVVFIILYLIQQAAGIISIVGYLVVRYNPFGEYFTDRLDTFLEGGLESEQQVLDYGKGVLGLSLTFSLVIGAVLIMLSIRRMNRYLNLE